MNEDTPNIENLVYLYICKNPILFDSTDDDFFKNKFVSDLFYATKLFYRNFKTLPFDIDNRTINQIKEFVNEDNRIRKSNQNLSEQENFDAFINNASNILETPYERYSPKWIKTACDTWIQWENSQKGFRLAVQHSKTARNAPLDKVPIIIKECKDIIAKRSVILMDDDLGDDFWDAKSHLQVAPDKLYNCGFNNLNKWCCSDGGGGFEPGTLTILVGEPNIGKSIWLGNLASNFALNGNNVLLISLEMKSFKIFKRIGANILNIKMNDYNKASNNPERFQDILNGQKSQLESAGIPVGMFRTKKFATASPSRIENFVKNVEEKLGEKIHVVVLDYLTELQSDHGITMDQMYQLHKQNAGDLFALAETADLAMVTAHQLKLKGFGMSDIDLGMLGESSGLTHRADNIYAIIQPPKFKLERKFHLKNLKTRDSEFKDYRIEYKIDYDHMRLTEVGSMIAPEEYML